MRILGVDPGTRVTGYGLIESIDSRLKVLEVGTIEPKKTDALHNRIYKIYTILEKLIKQYRPDVLVLEKLYAHYKHPATVAVLGHVRGVICLLCAQERIELAENSVKRIRKAVVGNGNATKAQTRKVVSHVLSIAESQLTLDASDALALSLGYIYMNCRHL